MERALLEAYQNKRISNSSIIVLLLILLRSIILVILLRNQHRILNAMVCMY